MRHLIEKSIHDRQVALMRFLSDAAKKLGVAEHVYVVGGAVRDFALGMPIKDVDVVIDSVALKGKDSDWFAAQLKRMIPAKTVLTTNNYGVAILSVAGPWPFEGHDLNTEVIEIANAREESYGGEAGKGYKPSEVAAANIKKDVYRREFTFNTLMWRLSDLAKGPDKAEIIDLTGCGMRDLERGEMACPSSPDKTFRDDPTRMLRAIKFLVRYDWKITPEVRDSIKRNANLLKKVPYEAITTLLVNDVLKERTYKKALKEMDELGLLAVVAEMTREKKGMASALRNWVKDKKAQVLFALIDAGLPVGSRIGFLSKKQQNKLRELVIGMPVGDPERLIDVLKQPGKVMNTKQMMYDLDITGRAVGQLSDMARDILLKDPKLMHDGTALTKRVMDVVKKNGLKEDDDMRELILFLEGVMTRCSSCGGPAHEATGWVLNKDPLQMLCGRCAKDFYQFIKDREGQFKGHVGKAKKLMKKAMKKGEFPKDIEKEIKRRFAWAREM